MTKARVFRLDIDTSKYKRPWIIEMPNGRRLRYFTFELAIWYAHYLMEDISTWSRL